MTEAEFIKRIGETKALVLGAVRKHLLPRHRDAVDDVVQETYLRAFRKIESFEERSALGTWLYSIAKNECRRMNQKLSRRADREDRQSVEHLQAEVPERAPGVMGDEVREGLGGLPDKIRAVMEKTVNGFSEKETAEALGIPLGTVKSRASKGRELLSRIVLGKKNSGLQEGGAP